MSSKQRYLRHLLRQLVELKERQLYAPLSQHKNRAIMDLEVFLSQSVTDINLWYMDLCWGIKHSTLAQTALKLFISLFVYNIIVCNQSIWDFNWIDVFQTHPHLSMEIKQRKVNTVARHNKCHWPWHYTPLPSPPLQTSTG